MIVPTADPIWEAIRNEAAEETRKEPLLANFLYGVVLNHKTFEDALVSSSRPSSKAPPSTPWRSGT